MGLIILVLMLGATGIATAATGDGTASLALTPNRASANSTVSVKLTGLSDINSLPQTVGVLFAPGFSASAQSVRTPCTPAQARQTRCPSASQVGTGSFSLDAGGSVVTLHTKLYLGHPLHAGDIANVYSVASLVGIAPETFPARLFRSHGQLELLFEFNPTPAGTPPIQFLSFGVKLHAVRTLTTGSGRRRHTIVSSLITNPTTCSGAWTGTATITYPGGSDALGLSAPCEAR